VTIPEPLTTPKPQSLHLLAEIRDCSEANPKLAIPKSQPPLISTPPNTPIHLESSGSDVQNPKKIPSENPKQPTLIPHPRVDTQDSNLSTTIRKPIRTRQATITLEFLPLPAPKSPPLPPKDPQTPTAQEHTKEPIPTVAQPNPSPTLCRAHYRTSASHLPCVAVINPPPDGFDAGHKTITPNRHSVPTIQKLSTPTAELPLSHCIAQDSDEESRSSCFFWLAGKEQGRIFFCLIYKTETGERELARGEKRTEISYVWFRKRKKKKLKHSKALVVQMVQEASGWSKRTKAKKKVGVLQVAVRGKQETKDKKEKRKKKVGACFIVSRFCSFKFFSRLFSWSKPAGFTKARANRRQNFY
jgi:hypothetical protein